MKVIKSIDEMRQWSHSLHLESKTISLVPTMGYLHEGHLSLIRKALELGDKLVVSIFINPTQFAPGEDFNKYPKNIEGDIDLCKSEKVDAIFIPDKNSIYLPNHQTYVNNEKVNRILCGRSRPDHFKGVITIVAKLLNIIDPDFAVFGQKDAQQVTIIKNMVIDLNFKTRIIIEPIIREKDGLAMSSRNKYLSKQQRESALIISKCLSFAEEAFKNNTKNTTNLKTEIIQMINNVATCKVDYVEFVNAATLEQNFKKGDRILLAIAVTVGKTRLIDNTILMY